MRIFDGMRWGAAIMWALLVVCGVARSEMPVPSVFATIDAKDGSYWLRVDGLREPIVHAVIAAKIDGRWIESAAYAKHTLQTEPLDDALGHGAANEVVFASEGSSPELRYRLIAYPERGYATVQVTVRNTTQRPVQVEALRLLQASDAGTLNLGAHAATDRVLSDSFSEDTPAMRIRDLRDGAGDAHLGVGSQLIYNRTSHWSFFAGALSADRFLTLLKLTAGSKAEGAGSYVIESAGTTEINAGESLAESPAEERMPLSLTLAPGESMSSERVLLSVDREYHRQLETYGALVRTLQHARVSAPVALGWWSWTAYYYGLSEGAALSNAQWLAQHLAPYGFRFFHLDEGYQYARGEYTTPDAALYPHGVAALEQKVQRLGLTPGIWTAPFEVSERSEIFAHHPGWLVHNAAGAPIPINWANNHHDRLYVLDTTHPEAQAYLRMTYETLTREWGTQYLKLDFMDASAIEGVRYRRNTTALEAQRIGLEIIRKAVGDAVLLDKDGSPMLSAVGFVDYGRTGQDTGHTFTATREAATGVIARYYMNRNFFVNDPDAFTVSQQTVKDHAWNGGTVPLTLEEAKASLALSAVAGSMFEIGDDLPLLGSEPERLALVTNADVLDMVKTGRASLPVDLMDYDAADVQPSILVLHESPRQSIVTVFNWTNAQRSRTLSLAALRLTGAHYRVIEIFGAEAERSDVAGSLGITQPAHSVRMYRVVDTAIPARRSVALHAAVAAHSGEVVRFDAIDGGEDGPALEYAWNFGDGTSDTGASASHAYTHPGRYRVTLEATGVGGVRAQAEQTIEVEGEIPSAFVPEAKRRPEPQ